MLVKESKNRNNSDSENLTQAFYILKCFSIVVVVICFELALQCCEKQMKIPCDKAKTKQKKMLCTRVRQLKNKDESTNLIEISRKWRLFVALITQHFAELYYISIIYDVIVQCISLASKWMLSL